MTIRKKAFIPYYFRFTVLLILSTSLCSCSESDDQISMGIVGFSVSSAKHNTIGRQQTEDQPTSLIFSIKNENDELVFDQQTMPLISIGEHFIAQSIELPVGNYYLTEFILVNDSGEAKYIAPIEGSEKARFSHTPLPLLFTVLPEGNSTIPVDALQVEKGD